MRLPNSVGIAIVTSRTYTSMTAGDALSGIVECVCGSVRAVAGPSVLDVRAAVRLLALVLQLPRRGQGN